MKAKRLWENVIHGWFLLMGLVTVGCVLLITVYLVISGIPAIREIGLIKFLFGPVWDSNGTPPQFGILSFILTSIYGTAGALLLGVPLGLFTAVFLAKAVPPQSAFWRASPRWCTALWVCWCWCPASGRSSIFLTAPDCWRPSSYWPS